MQREKCRKGLEGNFFQFQCNERALLPLASVCVYTADEDVERIYAWCTAGLKSEREKWTKNFLFNMQMMKIFATPLGLLPCTSLWTHFFVIFNICIILMILCWLFEWIFRWSFKINFFSFFIGEWKISSWTFIFQHITSKFSKRNYAYSYL